MELKEKIELIQSSSEKAILNGGGHDGTPLLKYVYDIHEEVFGYPCKSCSDAIPGYIKKIKLINTNTTIMSKNERQFRMKSGSVIRVKGTNKYYSDLNLTDDVAKELLEKNPNRIALFAKVPEKFKAEIGKAKPANGPEENKDEGILSKNVTDFGEAVKSIETVAELDELTEKEKAGEDRKGIYKHIESRRAELEA